MRSTIYGNPYINKLNGLINKNNIVLADGPNDASSQRPLNLKDQKK